MTPTPAGEPLGRAYSEGEGSYSVVIGGTLRQRPLLAMLSLSLPFLGRPKLVPFVREACRFNAVRSLTSSCSVLGE